VIGVKDSFTRLKQAQEEERKLRIAEQQNKVRAAAVRRRALESLRRELGQLWRNRSGQAGKALEGVLMIGR